MFWRYSQQRPEWMATDRIIDRWLKERQLLLVLMNRLSMALNPRLKLKEVPKILQTFCQILVDYTSAGHFQIYEKLGASGFAAEGGVAGGVGSVSVGSVSESGNSMAVSADMVATLDGKLLALIEDTTEEVVYFNDKYTKPKGYQDLPYDFSKLAERLAMRFDCEDQLVQNYLDATSKVDSQATVGAQSKMGKMKKGSGERATKESKKANNQTEKERRTPDL